MTSACASFSLSETVSPDSDFRGVLATGAPVAPPPGLIEFCKQSESCAGGVFATSPAESVQVTRSLGGVRRAEAPWARERRAATAFHLMLGAAAASAEEERPRTYEVLTSGRWRELARVNRSINRLIAPTSDEDQFGIEERWFTPVLSAREARERPRGDCEDYALEKRRRLLALGWRADTLALALVRLPEGELHTVLIAQTDQGDFVLDNLHALPQPVSAPIGYDWLSRQNGADLDRWVAARLTLWPRG